VKPWNMLGRTRPGDATQAVPRRADIPPGGMIGGMSETPGYHDDKAAYLTRLRRIEGQVRGLQRLVEEDTYCLDILTQVSAVTKALQGVAVGLVEDHLGHCVRDAVAAGGASADEKVAEASTAIARLLRT
jgi:CsoR family transcriptional regulator, copper-sensing transcriptional repressor